MEYAEPPGLMEVQDANFFGQLDPIADERTRVKRQLYAGEGLAPGRPIIQTVKAPFFPPLDSLPRHNLILGCTAAACALLIALIGCTLGFRQHALESRRRRRFGGLRISHGGSIDAFSFPPTRDGLASLAPTRNSVKVVDEEPSPFIYDPLTSTSPVTPSPAAWPDSRLYYTPSLASPRSSTSSHGSRWRLSRSHKGHQPSLGVTMEEREEEEEEQPTTARPTTSESSRPTTGVGVAL